MIRLVLAATLLDDIPARPHPARPGDLRRRAFPSQ
jgi:hypothetical protein